MRKIIPVAVGATALALAAGSLSYAAHTDIALSVDGATRTVTSRSSTVAEVLQEQHLPVGLRTANITVDGDDQLSAKPSAPLTNGAMFTYTRVDSRTLTKTSKVSYDISRRHTSSLKVGMTRVDTTGRAGTRTVTYREIRHNGRVVSLKQVGSAVTTKPRTQVVLVGTAIVHHRAPVLQAKPQQAVKQSPSSAPKRTSPASRSSSSAPAVASGGVWDKIARCESGGNWSISTGNGFYGGLQFTVSTWRAFGGSGMPNHASRSQQIAVAKRVQASQGWGAWPACTSKLGLR